MKKNKIFNIYFLFFLLSISLVVTSELVKMILNLDKLIVFYLSERMSSENLKNYLEFQIKWKYTGFLIFPILVLFKTVIISSILNMGVFFHSNTPIKFKIILNVVLKAEFVFLLFPVFKLIWFCFFQINYTLEDIQYFYPFSALNIIGYKGLEPWLIYPLQTLNVFELAYIIILSYQIGTVTKTNADTGLKIVASSYVPALLLWVTIVMFFTLNFS